MNYIKKNIQNLKKNFHPLLKKMPKELRAESWLRIAHSKEHGFLYIRIPKAANSTISKTLATYCFPQKKELLLSDPTGEKAKKLLGNLGDLKYYRYRRVLKDFFVFSFFRNPYTRILSAYLDKIQSNKVSEKYHWVAKYMNMPNTMHISFSDFISFLENGNLFQNAHWAPQTYICPFSIHDLNFVGKVESINTDLSFIIKKIFGENIHNETIMCDQHRQNANNKLKKYYDKKIAKRVHELYKTDFELLKYDLPISLEN